MVEQRARQATTRAHWIREGGARLAGQDSNRRLDELRGGPASATAGVRAVAADAGDEALERDARARCTSPRYLDALRERRSTEPVVMPELRAARARARHPGQRRPRRRRPRGRCARRSPPPSGWPTAPASPTPSAARPATTPAPTSSAATATSTTPPPRCRTLLRRRACARSASSTSTSTTRTAPRRWSSGWQRRDPALAARLAGHQRRRRHRAAAGARANAVDRLRRRPDADAYLAEVAASIDALAADSAALVVSLGYDTVAGDPHGSWSFAPEIFAEIGRLLAASGLPVCVIQEGGYSLPALAAVQPRLRHRPARRGGVVSD